MNKIKFITIILVMVASLVGCNMEEESGEVLENKPSAITSKTINLTMMQPETINPITNKNKSVGYIMNLIYDSLFTIEYANTVSETKLLFSIAHELGHLILHFLEDNGSDKLKMGESVNIGEVEEYEANEFAAYLLMPDKQFISKCKQFSENGMIPINKLAKYFHVSNRTAIVRGMVLGLW